MRAKALEIRDEGTFIAALAVDMNPGPVARLYERTQAHVSRTAQLLLLRRCGYPCDGQPNIILTSLHGVGKATNDPSEWGDRTWATAHRYIIEHWHELKDGDVVDVEFILGERAMPKVSERVTRTDWQPLASAPLDRVIDLYAEGRIFNECRWDAARAIWRHPDGLRLKAMPTRWRAATHLPPSRALPSEPTSAA